MFEAAEGLGDHVNLIWKPPKQRLSENEKIDVIKTVQNAYLHRDCLSRGKWTSGWYTWYLQARLFLVELWLKSVLRLNQCSTRKSWLKLRQILLMMYLPPTNRVFLNY